MRNLKRALSLTLASVMLLGMMIMGSSAAGFPDVDEEDNVEAIEVLNAVEVILGYEDGNFGPDDLVTRDQMAAIMARLLNLDYQYYEASCPFTDVPDWAKGYVGACYANGVTKGYSATTYGSSDGITPVQGAAMMMRALGYFKYDGDYTDGFEVATVRQGTEIGMFKGVGSSATASMTRDQVARMALNALKANMVAFTGTPGIEINGVVVGYRAEYTSRTGTENKYSSIEVDGDQTTLGNVDSRYYIQLGEELYNGDLKMANVSDGFKAPAVRWSYKNTEIGTYTKDADYMLKGEIKSSEMYTTVGKTAAENYEWTVYMDGATGTDANRNSEKTPKEPLFGRDDVSDNDSDVLTGPANGTETYIYLSSKPHTTSGTDYAGYATVCIVNIYGAEVTKVKDGVVTLNDKDRQLEVEASGYAEGDVVLYSKYVNGSGWKVDKILGRAELVEGEAKTVRKEKFVTIGDKTYNYNAQFNSKNGNKLAESYAGQEVALYLDGQGNIVFLGDAKEGTDYALVVGVGKSAQYNARKPIYGAELILSDGTYRSVILNKDLTDDIRDYCDEKLGDMTQWAKVASVTSSGATDDQYLMAVEEALVGKVFAYTEEKGGSFDLSMKVGTETRTVTVGRGTGYDFKDSAFPAPEVETLEVEGDGAIVVAGRDKDFAGKDEVNTANELLKNGKASANLKDMFKEPEGDPEAVDAPTLRFDDDTIFILNDKSDSETAFTVYTGYKNVPDVKLTAYSTVSAYRNANNVTRVIFITNCSVDSAKDVVFIVGKTNAKEEKTGSVSYKEYAAVVNGEVTKVQVKKNTAAEETMEALGDDIGIFAGITINSDGYVTRLKDISAAEDMEVNGATGAEGDEWEAYEGTNNVRKGVYSFGYSENDKGKVEWSETCATNDKVLIVYYGEYNNKNDQLHIETSLEYDKNDEAYVVTDDDDVVAIFVVKVDEDKDNDVDINGEYTFTLGEDDKIYITSSETLSAKQLKAIIAKEMGASASEVSVDLKNGTVTVDGVTYDLAKSSATVEEVEATNTMKAAASAVKGAKYDPENDALILPDGSDADTLNAAAKKIPAKAGDTLTATIGEAEATFVYRGGRWVQDTRAAAVTLGDWIMEQVAATAEGDGVGELDEEVVETPPEDPEDGDDGAAGVAVTIVYGEDKDGNGGKTLNWVVPAPEAEEEEPGDEKLTAITEITFKTFTAPANNGTVANPELPDAGIDGVSAISCAWTDKDDNTVNTGTQFAAANNDYTLVITITVEEGYELTDGTTVPQIGSVSGTLDASAKTITYTFTVA